MIAMRMVVGSTVATPPSKPTKGPISCFLGLDREGLLPVPSNANRPSYPHGSGYDWQSQYCRGCLGAIFASHASYSGVPRGGGIVSGAPPRTIGTVWPI